TIVLAAHFVPYAWLYSTPLYAVVAGLMALAVAAVVLVQDRWDDDAPRLAGFWIALANGLLLLLGGVVALTLCRASAVRCRPAAVRDHTLRARRVPLQQRRGPHRSPLQSAPAVGAGPVGEGRDARGAPRALERADVGLVVDGEVTVAALAVRAQLEHAGKRRTAEPRPPDPAPPTPARSAGVREVEVDHQLVGDRLQRLSDHLDG